MNEQHPFAAIPTSDAAAHGAATPAAQDARSPQERRARGESEVLAAGLPAWGGLRAADGLVAGKPFAGVCEMFAPVRGGQRCGGRLFALPSVLGGVAVKRRCLLVHASSVKAWTGDLLRLFWRSTGVKF